MRRTAPWPADFAYHYPRGGYYYQPAPQLYSQEQTYAPQGQAYVPPGQAFALQGHAYVPQGYAIPPQVEAHVHGQQGYYNQPLYHCPTCGTPIYVVYVTVPQPGNPPNGLAALLVAVLVLLAMDIVFLRKR